MNLKSKTTLDLQTHHQNLSLIILLIAQRSSARASASCYSLTGMSSHLALAFHIGLQILLNSTTEQKTVFALTETQSRGLAERGQGEEQENERH